jgi:2-polyprenyl-3-methyl-5-hydroxy-6-metoxy-1,4-benzoquinol methylase
MAATTDQIVEQADVYEGYLSGHYQRVMDPRHRARKIAFIRHNYECFLPPDRTARILEIGPGFGELIEWLTGEMGYTNVRAMDVSQEVVDHCNSLLPNCAIHVEDPETELRQHPESYDCIFMLHVLEHVPKEQIIPLLQALHRALVPLGRLIIEVPNMGNPFTGLNMRYADFTHEVGFTDLSLHFVLQKAGFREVQMQDATLANDRPSRPIQYLVHRLARCWVYLVYRSWAIRPPAITAPMLSVCATKQAL